MKRYSLFVVLLMLLVMVMPVSADGSVVINGGSLSVTAQDVDFGSVTLTGAAQTLSDVQSATQWAASDPTGTGSGWHVTIEATAFTDGTHTIPLSNFRVLLDSITTVDGNTAPTSSIGSYTALSGTPQTLMTAGVGEGMGSYTFHPKFQLLLDADTYAGTYASTITVAIVSGP